MYHRILVPITEAAEVEPLIRFASHVLDPDGEVRLIHLIPAASLPEVAREWRSAVGIVVPAHEAGAALDIRVEPEVRAAVDVPGEILETAEIHGVDAILMTLRGDRRSRNPFVGHTASAILHHAACDVLIANRLLLAQDRFARLLLPTFGGEAPGKALRLAEEMSIRGGGVPLVTLAMSPRGASAGESEEETVTPRGVRMVVRRSFFAQSLLGRYQRLPELILGEAARQRYGLLVVGENESPSLRPLLTRSFLEELFRTAPCPVLAVRG
jgi:nucleotide-binding universal stress UspA family protein